MTTVEDKRRNFAEFPSCLTYESEWELGQSSKNFSE